MSDPTARTLELLSLLPSRPSWSGPELCERLGVSPRTLRRDIDRLRDIGYGIDASPGTDGGYRLSRSSPSTQGGQLPPLLLTEDDAVAVAVGLRLATASLGDELPLAAMVKLEQMLPRRLHRRVTALQRHAAPARTMGTFIDPGLVAALALACHDRERVRFSYVSALRDPTSRHVEPHALVASDARWYLVCWDLVRDDWRTFRLDRMGELLATGVRFAPRELPVDDPAEMVVATETDSSHTLEGMVHMDLTLAETQRVFGVWATGATANDRGGTDWPIGGSTLAEIVYGLAWIPSDVTWTITGDPELVAQLTALGGAVSGAVGTGGVT